MSAFNKNDTCLFCDDLVTEETVCLQCNTNIHCVSCCRLLDQQLDLTVRPYFRAIMPIVYDIWKSKKIQIEEHADKNDQRRPKRIYKQERIRIAAYQENFECYKLLRMIVFRNILKLSKKSQKIIEQKAGE